MLSAAIYRINKSPSLQEAENHSILNSFIQGQDIFFQGNMSFIQKFWPLEKIFWIHVHEKAARDQITFYTKFAWNKFATTLWRNCEAWKKSRYFDLVLKSQRFFYDASRKLWSEARWRTYGDGFILCCVFFFLRSRRRFCLSIASLRGTCIILFAFILIHDRYTRAMYVSSCMPISGVFSVLIENGAKFLESAAFVMFWLAKELFPRRLVKK